MLAEMVMNLLQFLILYNLGRGAFLLHWQQVIFIVLHGNRSKPAKSPPLFDQNAPTSKIKIILPSVLVTLIAQNNLNPHIYYILSRSITMNSYPFALLTSKSCISTVTVQKCPKMYKIIFSVTTLEYVTG